MSREELMTKHAVMPVPVPVKVINIGLELFGAALTEQGVAVAQVLWSPPATVSAELLDILDDLL